MKNYNSDLDALNMPWVDSPFFLKLIENVKISKNEIQLAKDFYSKGYVIIDLLQKLRTLKLESATFNQREFYRLQHIEHLYNSNQIDGNLFWIIDMYTVSDKYPYAQPADTRRINENSGLPVNFNYLRNSVKAVVNAYDGTMNFYVVDEKGEGMCEYCCKRFKYEENKDFVNDVLRGSG